MLEVAYSRSEEWHKQAEHEQCADDKRRGQADAAARISVEEGGEGARAEADKPHDAVDAPQQIPRGDGLADADGIDMKDHQHKLLQQLRCKDHGWGILGKLDCRLDASLASRDEASVPAGAGKPVSDSMRTDAPNVERHAPGGAGYR